MKLHKFIDKVEKRLMELANNTPEDTMDRIQLVIDESGEKETITISVDDYSHTVEGASRKTLDELLRSLSDHIGSLCTMEVNKENHIEIEHQVTYKTLRLINDVTNGILECNKECLTSEQTDTLLKLQQLKHVILGDC